MQGEPMRKYGLILILLLLCTSLNAQEFTISTGMDMNYFLALFLQDMSGNSVTTITHFGGFGAYADFTYVRLMVDYSFLMGGVNIEDSGTHDLTDSSIDFLNIYLLGKYPFTVGNIVIWPSLGILYSYCVNFRTPDSGGPPLDEYGFRDVHLVGGVGLDFKFDNMVFSPYFQFAYNLMPDMFEDQPPDIHITQLTFVLGISFGYILK